MRAISLNFQLLSIFSCSPGLVAAIFLSQYKIVGRSRIVVRTEFQRLQRPHHNAFNSECHFHQRLQSPNTADPRRTAQLRLALASTILGLTATAQESIENGNIQACKSQTCADCPNTPVRTEDTRHASLTRQLAISMATSLMLARGLKCGGIADPLPPAARSLFARQLRPTFPNVDTTSLDGKTRGATTLFFNDHSCCSTAAGLATATRPHLYRESRMHSLCSCRQSQHSSAWRCQT